MRESRKTTFHLLLCISMRARGLIPTGVRGARGKRRAKVERRGSIRGHIAQSATPLAMAALPPAIMDHVYLSRFA